MNIEGLFSTKERIKILKHVVYKSGYISVNKIARDIKLSNGMVSKYLDLLSKEGIIKRADGKFVVKNSIQTRTVRILLNFNAFDADFFKKYRFVKGAGLYGSFAKGTNTEESDIDLWLFIEKTKESDLANLTTEVRRYFGNVKPLYLTKDKIQLLKKEDVTFYHSLIYGSIIIYGDGIEAV